jgi:alkylation response protein AidB-like acyl-CoA dehydrogenase
MEFSLSEDQQSLRELAAQVLSDGSTDETLRAFAADQRRYDEGLWGILAEAGLLGAGIDAAYGGSGFGLFELGLILEEQGRTLAPLPLLETLVLGAMPIQKFGNDAQKARWLPAIVRGETILAAAIDETRGIDPARPMPQAARDGGGWRLNGTKLAVPYGAEADLWLVPATTGAAPVLFLVDPRAPGTEIMPQQSSSGQPQAQLRFADCRLGDDDVLGGVEQGEEVIGWTIQQAQVGLSAFQLGVAAEALRRTTLYTKERVQFGRPIGSMQAVQQRVADAFIDVEAMRSTYLQAAWVLSRNETAMAEVATAKYWAAIGGHRVVHAAQHLHGGMGADISYPIHRYFLAATRVALALGGAQPMLALIGSEIAAGKAPRLT